MRVGNNQAGSSLPVIAVCSAVLIWGVFWMPLRWFEASGLHGAWVTFAINIIATANLLPILAIRSIPKPKLNFKLVVIGLTLGGGFAGYFTGLLLTEIVKALVLFYTTPIWGTLFGILMLGEKLTLHRCLAVASCVIGLVVVLGGGDRAFPIPSNAGDWLALAGGMSWCYGTTLLVREEGMASLYQCLAMFIGGLALAGLAILVLPVADAGMAPTLEQTVAFLPGLLAFTVIMFVPSNYFAIWGSRVLSPGFVGMLIPMEIIIGIVTVALLSGDKIAPRQFVGAAMIISSSIIDGVGSILARRRDARAEQAAQLGAKQ